MTKKPLGLIIEDNEDQNWVFTTALQQAGYETESIGDGLIARRRLLEIVPNMIILDLHIPHIDGEDLLRQIRSDRRLSKVRVVLATADAVKAEELQPQADLVLLKPISFSQLTLLAGRLFQNP